MQIISIYKKVKSYFLEEKSYCLLKPILIICFIRASCRFQQSFSHTATVSGCGRELNAHSQSAASLTYHTADT